MNTESIGLQLRVVSLLRLSTVCTTLYCSLIESTLPMWEGLIIHQHSLAQ